MISDERRLQSAKRLCAGRMARRDEFPQDMFGDWPWSMLMLTYVAQREGRPVSPDDLYAEAGVGAEIGRRWMEYLRQMDLMTATSPVELTGTAWERLERYLDRVIHLSSTPVAP